jgi:hypothetical protein
MTAHPAQDLPEFSLSGYRVDGIIGLRLPFVNTFSAVSGVTRKSKRSLSWQAIF